MTSALVRHARLPAPTTWLELDGLCDEPVWETPTGHEAHLRGVPQDPLDEHPGTGATYGAPERRDRTPGMLLANPAPSVPLEDHPSVGDLSDCGKVYFDDQAEDKPRFRLVYRVLPNEVDAVAVEAAGVGRRQ